MRLRLAVLACLSGGLLTTTACTAGHAPVVRTEAATIVVSVPVTAAPWVARFATNGAQLAVDELNKGGGLRIGSRRVPFELKTEDNGGSAQQAVEIARRAVKDHALAIITDGTGARAVAAVTDPASLPVFIVFDGDTRLTDAASMPSIFRIAPADKPMATRLADYLAQRKPTVAIISDTTEFGSGGAAALQVAFARDHIPVRHSLHVDPSGNSLEGAIGAARSSGVTALVVWAGSPVVAAAVRAARSSAWNVAIYAGPTAEDPIVRQLLDDHPSWLDGTTFVSFRITAEVGPAPFAAFRSHYEKRFGVERVGVSAGARPVTMPPDWAMYGYDCVRLVAAAFANADGQKGSALGQAMNTTVITGANGDERGFGPTQREGVSPDDMYFGRFQAKRFTPVTDDILSTNLPAVEQG